MKIVLLKDVKGIGHADTVVNVSDGYARNFIFPNKLGITADANALKGLEERKAQSDAKRALEKAAFLETASKLKSKNLEITVDVGENGKLFGSVTHTDIAKKIHECLGIEIDKKKIVLNDPIRSTGTFSIPIKLGHEVTASVNVNVIAAAKA
jgi:large subunit ribosomal protein L9